MISKFKQSATDKGLYVATKHDVQKLVEVSCDGYGSSYPLCQWFDQGGDGSLLQCREYHPKGWASTWRANICDLPFDQAVILADSPQINAMAMWMAPNFKEPSNLDWFLNGGLASFFHMGFMEMIRFDTYETYCNSQRHKYGSDSFYLTNLVVRRSFQGRGLGTKLIRSSLEIIDDLKGSAYLETHTGRNMEMYCRFGFKVMCDDPIPGTVLKHYSMRRG